jgi:hypothetical protein
VKLKGGVSMVPPPLRTTCPEYDGTSSASSSLAASSQGWFRGRFGSWGAKSKARESQKVADGPSEDLVSVLTMPAVGLCVMLRLYWRNALLLDWGPSSSVVLYQAVSNSTAT